MGSSHNTLESQGFHHISGTRLWEVIPSVCKRSWLNLCLSIRNILSAASSLLYWGNTESAIVPQKKMLTPSLSCQLTQRAGFGETISWSSSQWRTSSHWQIMDLVKASSNKSQLNTKLTRKKNYISMITFN